MSIVNFFANIVDAGQSSIHHVTNNTLLLIGQRKVGELFSSHLGLEPGTVQNSLLFYIRDRQSTELVESELKCPFKPIGCTEVITTGPRLCTAVCKLGP